MVLGTKTKQKETKSGEASYTAFVAKRSAKRPNHHLSRIPLQPSFAPVPKEKHDFRIVNLPQPPLPCLTSLRGSVCINIEWSVRLGLVVIDALWVAAEVRE